MPAQKTLLSPAKGALSLAVYALNTLFFCIPLFFIALLKFIIPIPAWRKLCNRVLVGIANSWIFVNNCNIQATGRVKWDVRGIESLKKKDWYLVVSNHQSWVDILVLQKVFFRKIPFLKFFLKKSLIWVPFLGLAWWALDFPFMKRYSRAKLKKRPHLKGKDLEITKRACRKFKTMPVSVMNFVEGTRFSLEKHAHQASPYANLLKPKSGGIAFVLGAMGEQLHRIVNVTISYPQGVGSFWHFLCGRVNQIRVRVDSIPIEKHLLGDYANDPQHRERFQKWLNEVWREKDRQLQSMLALPEPEASA